MNFEEDPTPLQEKLQKVVETIGWIGITAAILTFFALVVRLPIEIWWTETRELKD